MTRFYDIFNGDADGLCALVQLRLHEPLQAELVTGVKRDIRLLERVEAAHGDTLTVLDVSLDANRTGLERCLANGAAVRWFDHHHAGTLPEHARFQGQIDTSSGICTSLIVDRHLGGVHRLWAVVGAFGDNMDLAAVRAAVPLGLAPVELARLRELGECVNYNAYGDSIEDLHYAPADLYADLVRYPDPRDFLSGEPIIDVLREGRNDDLYRAGELAPVHDTSAGAVYILPDAGWARRVNGVFANRIAQEHPSRAHAVLVTRGSTFRVSVRAPIDRPEGADDLCRAFDTGGGRKGAGGIDALPAADLDRFVARFAAAFAA